MKADNGSESGAPSIPGPDLLAPNEVDKAAASSTLVIHGVEKYFSQPMRQVYWEGNSDVPTELSISYVVLPADGGEFNVWLRFSPDRKAGETVSQDFAEAGGFLSVKDSPDVAKPREWVALTGKAVFQEDSGRGRINLTAVELQTPEGDTESLGSGSIEGVLERMCYAHGDQPTFADPVLDKSWSSEFCQAFR